jgi:RHS repeat-associated protein
LLTTTLGTGDTQNFTYDPNTGRMKSYAASVGSTPVVTSGTLTWNQNGTLQQNSISDAYNSTNTQNCSYQYDDFVRVSGVNCVNGSTKIWNQTFTYGTDAFGNITKSGNISWACTLCYDPLTNHYNSTLSSQITYDLDGNLKTDTFHTYTWNPDGHVASMDNATITYDADGDKVEENVGGVIHEYVSGFGVWAQMTGQIEDATTVALPGGVQAVYSGGVSSGTSPIGVLERFRFPDWEGKIRAESDPVARVFTESLAFAPFDERYALKGTPYNVDSFTGSLDQIVGDEYDFAVREEHNGQGRWISPDPMRGTGNKYVYADNNPLSRASPTCWSKIISVRQR